MRWGLSTISFGALLVIQLWAGTHALDRDAVYATQITFEASSPIVYTTTGICIESAVQVNSNIQVFLPQLQDVLANEFMGLAKNLAYIVDFHKDSPALATQATGFTINTSSFSNEELSTGIHYNVTVADISVGVRFDIASAQCSVKLGYA